MVCRPIQSAVAPDADLSKHSADRDQLGADAAAPTGHRVAVSLLWATSGRLGAQAVSWLATLWVVRLLTPADYGLMAMAMIVVAALQLFEEIGFGPVLVQTPDLDSVTVRKILGLVTIVAVVLCGILVLLAPSIARFFGHPELAPVLWALSLPFLVSPWIIIPRCLLERQFQFKRIAVVEIVATLLASLTTLALALRGAGVWALVAGTAVLAVAKAVAFPMAAPLPGMPSFSFRGLRGALRFGGTVTMERVLWFLYSQADLLIAGKLLGSHGAGLYVIGKSVARIPADKLAPVLQQVALPALSRIHERGAIGGSLSSGIGIVSLVSFPTFFGLAAVAPDLVPLLLGPHWESAVIVLQCYAAVLPLGLANMLVLTALKASGQPETSLANVALGTAIMLAAFIVGSRWGLAGLALGWVIAYPIYFAASVARSAPALGAAATKLVAGMASPLAASALMWALVTWLGQLLQGSVQPIGRLALLVMLGAGFYGAVMFALQRDRLYAVSTLLRSKGVSS